MTEYTLYNPTGNITALVTSPASPEERSGIAREILQKEHMAEQVGFLSDSGIADIRLDMACGEFCGNGTMSAALHRYLAQGSSGERSMTVSVSGTENPVDVTIQNTENGYEGRVKMPGPFMMRQLAFDIKGKSMVFPAVFMPGITHIILQSPKAEWLISPQEAEKSISEMAAQCGAEALGIMFYNPSTAEMRPLVYVADINSLYWEGSCASGTSALGYFLAATGALAPWDNLVVSQPGGALRVASPKPGDVYITGNISIMK